METKKTYYAYSLKDWEGAFAENPRERIEFGCTEKVFNSYEDARNEANRRLFDRSTKSLDYTIQVYADVDKRRINQIDANEQCYLKKLFDENNEELCTLQIVKYEYQR